MFEILYRITDSEEYLMELDEKSFDSGVDILGFFAINVNGYHYGRYHNYPLQPGECDWERITDWLLLIGSAYKALNHSGYALIDLVDYYNMWLEFRKAKDMVAINILMAEKEDSDYFEEIRLTPLEEFEYGDWYIQSVKSGEIHSELVKRQDETVRLIEIRSELSRKISKYLDELREINIKLLKNKKIVELEALLSQLT